MPSFKTIITIILLIAVAFGIGYGWGWYQMLQAQKEWSAVKDEMQSKISTLEKDLARLKARETMREMPETLAQVLTHLAEKNFGLAVKTLDGGKEAFLSAQANLDEEWKGKFGFFLPALEEIKKEADILSPNAGKKTQELRSLFEQTLQSPKKG